MFGRRRDLQDLERRLATLSYFNSKEIAMIGSIVGAAMIVYGVSKIIED